MNMRRVKKLAVSYDLLRNEGKKFCEINNIEDIHFSKGYFAKFLKRNKIVKRKATKIAQKDPNTLTSVIENFRFEIYDRM